MADGRYLKNKQTKIRLDDAQTYSQPEQNCIFEIQGLVYTCHH